MSEFPHDHNNPPEEIQEEISAYQAIMNRWNQFLKVADKWINDRSEIKDKATADKCADFIAQMNAIKKDAEKERKDEKAPVIAQGKAIDAKYNSVKKEIEGVTAKLKSRQDAWLKAEDERIKAEQAKQREAEAEAARKAEEARRKAEELAAEADAGNLEGSAVSTIEAQRQAEAAEEELAEAQKRAKQAMATKAKAGGTNNVSGKRRSASLRTYWEAEITNPKLAAVALADNPRVQEILLSVAKEMQRGDRSLTLPGVRFYEDKRS